MWLIGEDDAAFVGAARRALERAHPEIEDMIATSERTHAFPLAAFQLLKDLGMLGMIVPAAYGGSELDAPAAAPIIEELSYRWGALGLFAIVQNSLSAFPIAAFGAPEQRARYLPRMASGELIGCYLQTEPDHGSDAILMATRAERRGGRWAVYGSKAFITNGSIAGVGILFARTAPDVPGKDGITAFIADIGPGAPGFTVVRDSERKMGLHGLTLSQLAFDGFEIPEENVLGAVGGGWAVAKATLSQSRIWIAAQALGIARRALEEAVRYACVRKQFGKRIIDFPEVAGRLADVKTELDAATLLTAYAARAKAAGDSDWVTLASEAKLKASELAFGAARVAQLTFGGAGFLADFIAERLLRDASVLSIYEGTIDIQRKIIAHAMKSGAA